jgi:MFS family permease
MRFQHEAGVTGGDASSVRIGWLSAVRGFDRNVYLLFAVGGLLGFTYWGITYLLTNLFVLRLGFGTQVVGNLNALNYALHMAVSVPAGLIGVRFGTRRSMICGGVLALVGWGITPAAAFFPPGQALPVLIASRVLGSVGGALFLVNSNPALISAAKPGSGTYAFAVNGTIVSLTSFLGSICGGLLPQLFSTFGGWSQASPLPYGCSLWVAVAALVPALAALALFREPGRRSGKTAAALAPLPLGLIAVIFLVRFLRELGYGSVLNFLTLYLDAGLGMQTSLIGVLVSVSSIAAIVFTPLMPFLAGRTGTGGASLAGLVVMAVSALPLALTSHWAAAALGWAGMTAANSINEAAMQVYILEIVSPRWRSLMSGAANMATTLGLASSATAGGYLIPALGYGRLFGIGAALLFASSLAFAGHLLAAARKGRGSGGVGEPVGSVSR